MKHCLLTDKFYLKAVSEKDDVNYDEVGISFREYIGFKIAGVKCQFKR